MPLRASIWDCWSCCCNLHHFSKKEGTARGQPNFNYSIATPKPHNHYQSHLMDLGDILLT